ncbi:UNVERIFIED_CONTAM: hypothetical protein Scaly_1618600 [Sesamum calycinum]|uniref:Uncharacterized protein n=2 Tax=Sesamum TaxID=4181 RepID=A0AAE1T7H3_9LAMI|nr:hypothetical protein Sango_2728400 [Sesamum angolense]
MKAHRDLKIICNVPELELDERRPNVMPKAVYTLAKEQKRRVCEWICGLKFPDGYASNLARGIDNNGIANTGHEKPRLSCIHAEIDLDYLSKDALRACMEHINRGYSFIPKHMLDHV